MSGKDQSRFNGPGDHPSDGSVDDPDQEELQSGVGTRRERPPSQRYLPIEADSELRQKIEADPTIDPDHMDTLDGLKLLLASEAEKTRVYCGTLDEEGRFILDDLLAVAISEIEVEHATVVGVVNVMILRMLDIRAALKHNDLGLLPLR